MARQRQPGGSRLGTLLFAFGCLVVLGVTFGLGVLVGRHSGRPSAATPTATATAAEGRRGSSTPDARPAPPAPTLTFYQELTAPLGSPGPAPSVKGSRPGQAAKPKPEAAPTTTAAPPAPKPVPVDAHETPRAGTAEGRFTVQVGAYRSRGPAEAQRASLAAAGHDAFIVETESAGEARYRVRFGSFTTREAAMEAAARLGGERALSTYVTAR